MTESIEVRDLVEEALRMNGSALERHGVQIVREFAEVPPVSIEKQKVLQILVNLIGNAKDACEEGRGLEKRLTLRITWRNATFSSSPVPTGSAWVKSWASSRRGRC